MKYIVATTENQPKNEFGGRNFAKLAEIYADDYSSAKKEAKKYGKKTVVLTVKDFAFFSSPKAANLIRSAK